MENVLSFAGEAPVFFSDHTQPALAAALEKANAETDPAKKEALLRAAVADWPQGLDGYIALYKFYFRTGRYRDAEKGVWVALTEAARQAGFRRNYRLLSPGDADWLGENTASRLYLFSLKALGVVRLRRGRIALAKTVLGKLAELDPHDEVGGGAFLDIALSFDEDAA